MEADEGYDVVQIRAFGPADHVYLRRIARRSSMKDREDPGE